VRDIAPRLQKPLDRDALFQMLAIVQRLKSASSAASMFIDVSNMPFPASGIFLSLHTDPSW